MSTNQHKTKQNKTNQTFLVSRFPHPNLRADSVYHHYLTPQRLRCRCALKPRRTDNYLLLCCFSFFSRPLIKSLKSKYKNMKYVIQGSDKVLQKNFPEFLPIFKAFSPERCLDLGTFFPELLAKLTKLCLIVCLKVRIKGKL